MNASRAQNFCRRFGLGLPILLAPMAGACPPALSAAVASAGGLGACGALLFDPGQIADWARSFRAMSNGAVQFNLWIPDPEPRRDAAHEARVRAFLGAWGSHPDGGAGDARPPDFAMQCEAILAAGPPIVSSIMGLYPPAFVAALKARSIAWFATATTVAEARAAVAAGADAIVAQGMEAGGHRGAFEAAMAERRAIGLFALLPAVVDAVDVPVIAAGGIADGRAIAAALTLGASAVQIGTGFLRCPEAGTSAAQSAAIAAAAPEDTALTRAYSGRLARAIANDYVLAWIPPDAPRPAPYPVQRGLTRALREAALARDDASRMQIWAGQSARLARAAPAGELTRALWREAEALLDPGRTT